MIFFYFPKKNTRLHFFVCSDANDVVAGESGFHFLWSELPDDVNLSAVTLDDLNEFVAVDGYGWTRLLSIRRLVVELLAQVEGNNVVFDRRHRLQGVFSVSSPRQFHAGWHQIAKLPGREVNAHGLHELVPVFTGGKFVL